MIWQIPKSLRSRCGGGPPASCRRWLTVCVLSIAGLVLVYTLIFDASNLAFGLPVSSSKSLRPREAYVLFNPSSQLPIYMEHCHLLTIFALTHDTELRDPFNRDVVVMVTDSTSSEDNTRMEEAGAKIFKVPYSLKAIMPFRDSWGESYRLVWDKIWVWALTDYDRVLYLDSDIVLNRPVYPVWDDPHAWPEHGLAATADWQGIRSVPMPDGPYFNSGFMLVRPNMTMFEEIINVDMGDHTLQWPDQDLLNTYFSQDGPHPWEPLDHM